MSIMSKENVAKEYFEKYIKDFEKRIGKNLTTEFNEHLKVLLNQVEKQQKEIAERDKYNITTLPFEELKEIIEQNKNISIFGKEYISKDKIREIIGKYIDIQEHKKYTNQELYGEDLKNMINELLEEER